MISRSCFVLVAIILLGTVMVRADDFVVQDLATFSKLVPSDAKVQKVGGDMKFTEGPVWTPAEGGYLVFSDIEANELKRWDAKKGLQTYRKPSNQANGNTRDLQDRLITCEHATRRVVIEKTPGKVTPLITTYNGKKFNSPNDVVVKSDGSIWFTDPPYGLPKGQKREIDKQGVYCFKDGKVTMVASDFDMPNGLCFSQDEKKLYIADSGKPHHIRVFDVGNGQLKNDKVFTIIDKGVPDGIRCDQFGNIWSSAGDGVQIFAGPDGHLIGKILVPETPANLCFGGMDGKTLFITARHSLYSVNLTVTGATQPGK